MSTLIRLVVYVAVLGVTARAAAQAPETVDPSAKGRVLLLTNERILEGEITKVGAQYCIGREGSGQTWLPCSKAQRLFGSRDEVLQYLRTQANLDDVDERMRLARWCIQYELWPQALAELQAADELRPREQETLRLISLVERRTQDAAAPPNLPPAPIRVATPADEAGTAKVAANGPESNSECTALFARRVQPILMNTCAGCHASGKAGEFKLTQVFGDSSLSGKSSQENLTAVLSRIRANDPGASPLLRMAVTAHGGATRPPLRNRETPAYRTLEQWVKLTVKQTAKTVAVAGDAPGGVAKKPTKNVFEGVEGDQPKSEPTAKKEVPSGPKEVFAADQKEQHAGPADEFDPIIFNRRMHSDKK